MKGERWTTAIDAELRARFPERAEQLSRAVARDLETLGPELAVYDRSSNPLDRRIRLAANFLALIRTLRASEDDATIRAVCLEVAARVVRPRNAFEGTLRRAVGELAQTRVFSLAMRTATRRLRVVGTSGDGFDVEFVDRAPGAHAFGYDIHRCGIRSLFGRHGLSQYVPVLCEVDHLTSELAGLELRRTGTLATGAAKCDFRYYRR